MIELKQMENEASREVLQADKTDKKLVPIHSRPGTGESTEALQLISQETVVLVTAEGIEPQHVLLSKQGTTWLAVSTFIIYTALWIIYSAEKGSLWLASQNTSIALSQYSGFLFGYSWTFSEIFYKWYMVIIPLLLLFAPRKDSALKSITVFMISYTARQYIRFGVAETRPFYDTPDIVLRLSCDCSYGMPSGHSEGSAMLYSLLFYELFIQTNQSKKSRLSWTGIGIFIVLSVMFSRVYFGRHSIPQVVLGAWQGLTAFTLMLCFEKKLDKIALSFLNGNKKISLSLAASSLVIAVVSVILWYTVFEPQVKSNQLSHMRCFECWNDESAKIRNDLGPALMFCWIYPGLVFGLRLVNSTWTKYNPNLIRQHFNLTGLKRFLIVAVCYCPLIIVIAISYPAQLKTPISIVVYLLTGVLVTAGPIYLFQKWNLKLEGDLTIAK